MSGYCISEVIMETGSKHMDILPLKNWLTPRSAPVIISGPCSAESRQQVLATAEGLHRTGLVSVFRSGIWKPRTRPNGFEGHGEVALDWLTEVKEKFGFPIAVEVATPRHLEACLKRGVDIVWVGARTGVNPFSIQELAEAIKGVDIPVMIKNPLNPDLALWMGVIERFYLSGIKKLITIHRGFNTYEKTRYRNEPLWEIPIKLKSTFPQLPVFCDPSHIAGRRDLLQEVTQKALLLEADGFMIETHPNPGKALTDAAQQITPEKLRELVAALKIPRPIEENPCKEIEILRNRIDDLDSKLITLLAQRMTMVNDIAQIKKECKMTILQLKRWNTIMETRSLEAQEKGLSKEFIKTLLELLHKESIDIQSKVIT